MRALPGPGGGTAGTGDPQGTWAGVPQPPQQVAVLEIAQECAAGRPYPRYRHGPHVF